MSVRYAERRERVGGGSFSGLIFKIGNVAKRLIVSKKSKLMSNQPTCWNANRFVTTIFCCGWFQCKNETVGAFDLFFRHWFRKVRNLRKASGLSSSPSAGVKTAPAEEDVQWYRHEQTICHQNLHLASSLMMIDHRCLIFTDLMCVYLFQLPFYSTLLATS